MFWINTNHSYIVWGESNIGCEKYFIYPAVLYNVTPLLQDMCDFLISQDKSLLSYYIRMYVLTSDYYLLIFVISQLNLIKKLIQYSCLGLICLSS